MNRSAIKPDLFAAQEHLRKIDSLGDPLVDIEQNIDFAALATKVDQLTLRTASLKDEQPAYSTEIMVRILMLKNLNKLSDENMEFLLQDRLSYKRFCGLADSPTMPDRSTIRDFENRLGEDVSKALLDGVHEELRRKGFVARSGQFTDASLVPAPK